MNKKYYKFILVGFLSVAALFVANNNEIFAGEEQNLVNEYKSIERNTQGIKNYQNKVNLKVENYKNKNESEIGATITFQRPLTYAELEDYINKYQITPKQIQARGLEGEDRLTVAVKYQNNMNEIVQEQVKPGEFIGYIDMYAEIESTKQLFEIQKDSLTFLVDVSGDSFITGNAKDFFPHALSWLKEDVEKANS